MEDPISQVFSGERLPPSSYRSISEAFTFDPLQAKFLKENFAADSAAASVKQYLHNSLSYLSTRPKVAHGPLTKSLVRNIIHILKDSDDIDLELCAILNSLEPDAIRRLIFDRGALPHPFYRAYLRLLRQQKVPAIERARSIDEAVIENNDHITRYPPDDEVHLLTVRDLRRMLAADGVSLSFSSEDDHDESFSSEYDHDESFIINRMPVPATELPILDEQRPEKVAILGGESFLRSFEYTTMNSLDGLNWNNVMATGIATAASLLGQQLFPDGPFEEADINAGEDPQEPLYWPELRLYGLDSSQATVKLQEIFDTWKQNLQDDAEEARILRDMHYISFFERGMIEPSVRISLRLSNTKTATLLDYAHDLYAVGFDGTEVYMLPRCARALETGYVMMSSKIIFAQPQFNGTNPRPHPNGLYNCSEMGFGLRVPLIYSHTLEDGSLQPVMVQDPANRGELIAGTTLTVTQARLAYEELQRYRQPHGEEPGCKTLRRIAFLGQDATNRIFYGPTPLSVALEDYNRREAREEESQERAARAVTVKRSLDMQTRKRLLLRRLLFQPKSAVQEKYTRNAPNYYYITAREPDDGGSEDDGIDEDEGDEHPEHDSSTSSDDASRPIEELSSWNRRLRSEICLPAINCLESLISHCEGRRLGLYAAEREDIQIESCHLATTKWADAFLTEKFINPGGLVPHISIEMFLTQSNSTFFDAIRFMVEAKTGRRGTTADDYRKYLTGRTRIDRLASSVDGILNRDLKFAVMLTKDLEEFLMRLLPAGTIQPAYDRRAHEDPDHEYRGSIPPLLDSNGPDHAGNLRYFVVSREMMWTGSNDTVDHIYEACRFLGAIFVGIRGALTDRRLYNKVHRESLAAALLTRPNNLYPQVSADARWQDTGLPLREAMLFRSWAMATPVIGSGDVIRTRYKYRNDAHRHLYPVPEELFWGPEFEGGPRLPKNAELSNLESKMLERPWWFREDAYGEAYEELQMV